MAYLDDKGLDLFHGLLDDAHREAVRQMLLDYCHPVGSLYLSDDPTDPSVLFGGTWSPLDEGYIRIGEPGTGGSDTVTLVMNNLPSHSHSMSHTHTMAHTHTGPSHTHALAGSGAAASSNGAHVHQEMWTADGNSNDGKSRDVIYNKWSNSFTFTGENTKSAGAHSHSLTGNTAAAGTGNTGAASNATTSAASVETTGLTGKADPVTIEPKYRATYGWVRAA